MENIKEIAKLIKDGKEVLLTTHLNPDGDGIGAVLALFLALNKVNTDRMKVVRIAIDDPVPTFLKFFPSVEAIEDIKYVYEKTKFDTVVSIDVANKDRVGGALKFVKEGVKFINIDHHLSNELYGEYNYVDNQASSASEIVFELIKELEIEIDSAIAQCIYCGIINDTGNFTYNNTRARTFEIAAELKNTGIDNEKISENLFSNKALPRIKLLGYALENMVFIEAKKLAYAVITKEVLDKYKGSKEDTEGIVEELRSYSKCDFSLLLREDRPGYFKGSLRSKGLDVNSIAGRFGGGGHLKAAGFSAEMDVETIIKKVLE